MARNGTGSYTNPYPNFVSGTVISSDQVDANNSDIATALTQSIAVDGQSTVTGNIPFNNRKITGLAVGAAATDSANLNQIQANAYAYCGTMAGGADAGTLAPTPAITAYAVGQKFFWKASTSANTGAMTVAISGLTTIAVQNDRAALAAGDHSASDIFMGILDTTSTMQIMRIAGLADGSVTPAKLVPDANYSRMNLLDYGEVTNAIGSTGGGTQDINLELGNVVTATVDTSTNTFTFSNPTASDDGCSFTLLLTNGGSQTVNWPGAVDWPSATAPTLSASGLDILTFITVDGGTIWHGMVASTLSS